MIYIIRHGRTEMNKAMVLQGRSDIKMNDEGIAQAKKAADLLKKVKFAHVFSSPLIRARQTAQLIAKDADIIVDERLIEMDYGPYEGTDLKNPLPEIKAFFSDFNNNPVPEGMESLESVVKRTGEFIEDIKKLEGDILVATHAIAMKGILEYLTPDSNGRYWSTHIGNCAVYMAEVVCGKVGVPCELK